MEPTSRRQFLKRSSAVAAAAGVAAAVPATAARALTSHSTHEAEPKLPDDATVDVPVVAHVTDVRKGLVSLYTTTARSRSRTVASQPRCTTRRTEPGGGSDMSTHREAPEISKDPVADSTDLYAFVSPDAPTPSPSSPTTCRCRDRRAARTSTSSATTCSTRSTSTTTTTASSTSRTSSSSRPRSRSAARSSTTSGRSSRSRRRTGTAASSIRSPGSTGTARSRHRELPRSPPRPSHRPRHDAAGRPPSVPAVQHRSRSTPNYAALAGTAVQSLVGRDEGVRRSARRRVLRRSRVDLRPRCTPARSRARTSSRCRAAHSR